ncbi:MAG: DMT family transporter [Nitrospirales bacterium]
MPHLAILLSTLIWGATFPATKAVLAQTPPFSYLFLRFLLGTLVVLALLLAVRRMVPADRALVRMGVVAGCWLFVGYTLQTIGLQFTTVANSAFLTILYVVLVPLFLRRFGVQTWLSAGLAVLGVWLLMDPRVSLNWGDVLTLASAAAFAAHIICLERFAPRADPGPLLLWQLVVMVPAFGLAMVVEAPAVEAFRPTPVLVLALLVTGVLATGALGIQVWAQRRLPAPVVALLFSIEPVVAAWLAWVFLGERLGTLGWMGSAIILAAVVLGCLPRRAPAPALARAAGEVRSTF